MIPYPASLDPEALPMLLDAFRGRIADSHKIVHVAYDTLGFGLGHAYPDSAAIALASAAKSTVTFEDAAKAIEAHLHAHGHDMMKAAANVGLLPWKILIPAILQLLVTLFA